MHKNSLKLLNQIAFKVYLYSAINILVAITSSYLIFRIFTLLEINLLISLFFSLIVIACIFLTGLKDKYFYLLNKNNLIKFIESKLNSKDRLLSLVDLRIIQDNPEKSQFIEQQLNIIIKDNNSKLNITFKCWLLLVPIFIFFLNYFIRIEIQNQNLTNNINRLNIVTEVEELKKILEDKKLPQESKVKIEDIITFLSNNNSISSSEFINSLNNKIKEAKKSLEHESNPVSILATPTPTPLDQKEKKNKNQEKSDKTQDKTQDKNQEQNDKSEQNKEGKSDNPNEQSQKSNEKENEKGNEKGNEKESQKENQKDKQKDKKDNQGKIQGNQQSKSDQNKSNQKEQNDKNQDGKEQGDNKSGESKQDSPNNQGSKQEQSSNSNLEVAKDSLDKIKEKLNSKLPEKKEPSSDSEKSRDESKDKEDKSDSQNQESGVGMSKDKQDKKLNLGDKEGGTSLVPSKIEEKKLGSLEEKIDKNFTSGQGSIIEGIATPEPKIQLDPNLILKDQIIKEEGMQKIPLEYKDYLQ